MKTYTNDYQDNSMKFAVTGGAGFIGSNIVKLLIEQNHSVSVIDNLHTGKLENLSGFEDKIEFKEIDIRNFEELKNALKDQDGVFHEAALTIVQESFNNPEEYHQVNVEGTKNVFTIAKDFGFKVVYASSSSIYGNVLNIPIEESCKKNPINPYGKTKLDDEILAKEFANKGVEIIGLRYFNVYGIGQTGSYAGVITKFMNNLGKGKPPIINGRGEQVRDFIYVKDVALANTAAMQSKVKHGFFNIGTGKTISIKKLAEIMIKIYNIPTKPIFGPALKGDVEKSQASIELTEKLLGWRYKTELEEGLKKITNPN